MLRSKQTCSGHTGSQSFRMSFISNLSTIKQPYNLALESKWWRDVCIELHWNSCCLLYVLYACCYMITIYRYWCIYPCPSVLTAVRWSFKGHFLIQGKSMLEYMLWNIVNILLRLLKFFSKIPSTKLSWVFFYPFCYISLIFFFLFNYL